MYNLIQKMYALMVSSDVRIWQYTAKKEKQFEYQYLNPKEEPVLFNTLEEMINAAYERIDLLKKPLPDHLNESGAIPTSS